MKWLIEETGTPGETTLVLTVNRREQRRLQAYMRRDRNGRLDSLEPRFDSDDFLYDLLEPMFTDDCFSWLPEGTTADLTSAPMIGVLGDEMPGPPTEEAVCSGLYNCGRWGVERQLRDIFQPVLRRWAFMDYAVTSPQQELAETGRCVWLGGDYWGTKEAAEKGVAAWEATQKEGK
jgi:hypothetical protein